jgi:F420H(2)-dependent quinone reductase
MSVDLTGSREDRRQPRRLGREAHPRVRRDRWPKGSPAERLEGQHPPARHPRSKVGQAPQDGRGLRRTRRALRDSRVERRRRAASRLVLEPRRGSRRSRTGPRRQIRGARDASGDERPALWKLMTSIGPALDDHHRNSGREIPVVILERTSARRPIAAASSKSPSAESVG